LTDLQGTLPVEFLSPCTIDCDTLISNFTYSTALIQVHYNISFEVMSQKLNNDNILVEQSCAGIEK
jgi:hypothetical protein